MEVQVEDKGQWKRQLSITVPLEMVEEEMERVVATFRKKAAIPGFRKGKAPTELIRGRFQGDLESDLLNELIPSAYDEAVQEQKLRPIGMPRFHEIRFESGQPLSFLADIEVWPELEVTGYSGLELEHQVLDVDDSMLEEALETLRQNRADVVPVERPSQPGDLVTATLEAVDVNDRPVPGSKREDVRMEVGSKNLLQEFQEASVGVKVGERRVVEVNYPEGFGDEKLAGKTRRYRLIAREIHEKSAPELDDEFAMKIDPNLDLEGLKAKLRLKLESEELMESRQRLEETMIDKLLEQNPFAAPEIMMTYSLERILERARKDPGEVDEPGLRERFGPVVERMHRRDILLQNVARQESLALTDEELEADLESMAQDAGVEVPVLKKKMEEDGEIDRMRDTLQERKVLDFLVGQAKVTRTKKPRERPQSPGEGSRIIIP